MIDLAPLAGVAASVDPDSGRLALAPELAVEELLWRDLDAARAAYAEPPRDAAPLYHMANGITALERREPDSALRYELTSLRPGEVGGEWVKTIGHVHDLAPDGVGYPEAYEVVAGTAVFVLFRLGPLECVLVEAEASERFVIPPGWHHLALNPGRTAMVFADVVGRAVVPDYSLLRERRGAPLYLGPEGVRQNRRYEACTPRRVRASDLPVPVPHGRLAGTFRDDRGLLAYLLEPALHLDAWREFDEFVAAKG